MKRTDTHRPSAIVPSEYRFVALGNVKIEDMGDVLMAQYHRAKLQKDMERTRGTWSQHEHGGTCGVCGAWACWTVIFHHAKTNSYIATGSDCADKLHMSYDSGELDRFKRSVASAEKNRAGKAKAKLMLEEAGLVGAWESYEWMRAYEQERAAFQEKCQADGDETPWWKRSDRPEEPSRDRLTLDDMVKKMIAWGDQFTERQTSFARLLIDRIGNEASVAAARAAEQEAALPVPETDKRIKIEGEILGTRVNETPYGYVTKVLVQSKDGWKVWGTRPVSGATRGMKVSFMARVERSKDDPKFGFFSRPTKGEVITEEGATS